MGKNPVLSIFNFSYYKSFLFKVILSGKDVVLQSQTGSGKTLAFGIPILAQIDPNRAAVQAVIVVPTREVETCRYY